VCELSASPKLVTGWVVEVDNKVVGHIAFTKCAVGSDEAVFLLGPLAVSPKLQRKGLGKKLIELGLSDLAARNASMVFVLGDPAYYSRSGFLAERVVMPPFVLPAEWDGAWQSLKIDQSVEPVSAKLVVPPVWDKKALWSG
ncbi:MAG: N-acetyltransferase, partial [Pseudomonadota bacterium]